MNQRFNKTESGREEIKSRSRKLSRPARNLLLIIDASRATADWVQLVHGATDADLKQLLDEGLIEAKADAAAVVAASPAMSVEEALGRFSHDQIYSLLTSQARDRLGLVRGFKVILDVERCANVEDLRTLAVQFLDQVETHQGQAHARQMRRAIGARA
jgi:hypothetical protein